MEGHVHEQEQYRRCEAWMAAGDVYQTRMHVKRQLIEGNRARPRRDACQASIPARTGTGKARLQNGFLTARHSLPARHHSSPTSLPVHPTQPTQPQTRTLPTRCAAARSPQLVFFLSSLILPCDNQKRHVGQHDGLGCSARHPTAACCCCRQQHISLFQPYATHPINNTHSIQPIVKHC